ncbi:MAG: hypothetical protein EKK37_15150 [Sphingobacteriales bacterium]|nr:MAG: hypothetical protein EKK37_15150 [Sphingobacteriales bacterium]
MKKILSLLFLLTSIQLGALAQTEKKINEVLKLQITEEGGANGATVMWHPVLKRYYCPMAGNVSFPFQVFDAKGKLISPKEQTTFFDVRGMWYNPKTKKIYSNGYNDFGWAEYVLNAKGFPTEVKVIQEGLHQPDQHSVAAYDAVKNIVYFYNKGKIYHYDPATGTATDEIIKLTVNSNTQEKDSLDFEMEEDLYNYNTTTVVYTGVKGQEFGLLNTLNNSIDLFDKVTGKIQGKLLLPENAPLNESFNFAYANGMYWLFNKDTRIWTAYK